MNVTDFFLEEGTLGSDDDGPTYSWRWGTDPLPYLAVLVTICASQK